MMHSGGSRANLKAAMTFGSIARGEDAFSMYVMAFGTVMCSITADVGLLVVGRKLCSLLRIKRWVSPPLESPQALP